jgi:hypothetical protein
VAPKRHGAIDLRNAVAEVIARHVPIELARLVRLRNLWLELFPPSFTDHVWPMIVQDTRLIVHVHDSQWLHEMTYWRQNVLTKLHERWPDAGIEQLEGYVGELPPLHERRTPQPTFPPTVERPSVLPADVPRETIEALNAVTDPQLRETLARARMVLGRPGGS